MKIRRPAYESQAPIGSRTPAYKQSLAEKLADKKVTPYITLSCEHYTDWDTVEVYSCWQPRGKFWCESCNKWRLPLKRKRSSGTPPQEPLF